MPLWTSNRLIPLLVGLSLFAVADGARACLDLGGFCDDSVGWSSAKPLHTAGIPTDGMLLFEMVGFNEPELSPAALELAVTLDGMPVPGVVETVGLDDVLAWRPAVPLVPEALYVAMASLHSAQPGSCLMEVAEFELEFSTAAGPMPALVLPTLGVAEELVPVSPQSLDNFVCCDGGFAFKQSTTCGIIETVEFSDGFCAPIHSTGTLEVELEVIPSGDGPTQLMLAAGVVVDGVPEPERLLFGPAVALRATRSAAFCTEVVVRNLVTGATVTTPKQCHGAGLEAQLGPQVLTPDSPLLAAHCTGAPYTCAINPFEQTWDPTQCMPWPDGGTTGDAPTTGDTTNNTADNTSDTSGAGTSGSGSGSAGDNGLIQHGCACASGRAPGFGEALLGLLVLGRRRSRRR